VDGEVVIDGVGFLIQAKRYREAIRPEHVRAFTELCTARRCPGLFIHTGRTGNMSREAVHSAPFVTIISGRTLLALLTGADCALPSPEADRRSSGSPASHGRGRAS
jgi:restriction system protein